MDPGEGHYINYRLNEDNILTKLYGNLSMHSPDRKMEHLWWGINKV